MNKRPTQKELLLTVDMIRELCNQMERKIKQIKPEKEWLTTAEFADREGLRLKSISNYCSSGKYGDNQRKSSKGRWLIHKSELTEN